MSEVREGEGGREYIDRYVFLHRETRRTDSSPTTDLDLPEAQKGHGERGDAGQDVADHHDIFGVHGVRGRAAGHCGGNARRVGLSVRNSIYL